MTAHTHVHDHAAPHVHAAPPRALPGVSLLRMSLAMRLAIAGGFVAAIWIAVFWAIR